MLNPNFWGCTTESSVTYTIFIFFLCVELSILLLTDDLLIITDDEYNIIRTLFLDTIEFIETDGCALIIQELYMMENFPSEGPGTFKFIQKKNASNTSLIDPPISLFKKKWKKIELYFTKMLFFNTIRGKCQKSVFSIFSKRIWRIEKYLF